MLADGKEFFEKVEKEEGGPYGFGGMPVVRLIWTVPPV